MELYESAMAPSVMLIAAVMDLLEPNSEPHRKAEHARLARQAVGIARVPLQRPTPPSHCRPSPCWPAEPPRR